MQDPTTYDTREKEAVDNIIQEDDRRLAQRNAVFNPYSGEGSIGVRVHCYIEDFPGFQHQWLPEPMMQSDFIKKLVKCGSIEKFIKRHLKKSLNLGTSMEELKEKVIRQYIRVRIKHDFPYWCASFVWISPKRAGRLILFILNNSQRITAKDFERQRLADLPIREVVLKARQWGGSTVIQMYIAWLMLVHYRGASSAIEAHLNGAASNIQKMFRTMLSRYPLWLLHDATDDFDCKEKKWVGDSIVRNVIHVPTRECSIQVGSAVNPDSSRSFNVSFAHCSEVAVWPDTEERTPQKLVNAVCSGILDEAGTFIAYESTAKGEVNFFHDEYVAAKQAQQEGEDYLFHALFIAWYQIENYVRPFKTEQKRLEFAMALYEGRNNEVAKDNRHEPGRFLWWLWQKGASLDAIHWYVLKRTSYDDHASMANEFPSDDVEAFQHSGTNVFSAYDVEAFESGVLTPAYVGELQGLATRGTRALNDLRFMTDSNGHLQIWDMPETFDDGRVTDRYLVVVDIGGRWSKADWSVICVIDRYWMMEGDKPIVVAQWRGHIDHDLLAWKAVQIAHWYDDALLVIESNTLETKDKERSVDGDQSVFILDEIKEHYDNLYAREQSAEDIKNKAPRKYGFHTNTVTKPAIISNLIEVVRDGTYIERDDGTLNEYRTYQLNDGVYEAAPKHHDDRLMTRAIGLWICFRKMPLPKFVSNPSPKTSSGASLKTEASII